MPHSDILLTVAELAVAFAGFASLVGILGQPHSVDAATMNAVRLRAMLESALVALIFSLVPFLPYLFGYGAQVAWRISATGYVAINLARLWRVLRSIKDYRAIGAEIRWLAIVLSVQLVGILSLLAIVTGLAEESAAAAYVLALFMTIFASAAFFLRFAVSLLASQQSDA